jgi:uncharacterized protein (TIGR00369 family)
VVVDSGDVRAGQKLDRLVNNSVGMIVPGLTPVSSPPPAHASGSHQALAPSTVTHPGTTVREVTGRIKDMDRWLGNGGMELIDTVGGSFDSYGVDGEDLGWVAGTFVPAPRAANPHGVVQAGVHGLLLDAAMNFSINSALPGRDRTRATLEMKVETMRPALVGERYRLRGEVVRMARQVAYAEARVIDDKDQLVSRSTGTFLLHRDQQENGSGRQPATAVPPAP